MKRVLLALLVAATAAAPLAAQSPAPGGVPGWLGLTLDVSVVTPATPGSVHGTRMVVTDLFRGGPAERGGLRPGDVIVRLNGSPADFERFRSLTRRLQPGDPLGLTVLRSGRVVDLALEAGERPAPETLFPAVVQVKLDSLRYDFERRVDSLRTRLGSAGGPGGTLPVAPRVLVQRTPGDSLETVVLLTGSDGTVRRVQPGGSLVATGYSFRIDGTGRDSVSVLVRRVGGEGTDPAPRATAEWRPLTPYFEGANRVAGAELRALDPSLAGFFDVERGLLVVEVPEGTPARRSGLRAGDVIRAVQGTPLASVDQFRTAVARTRGPLALDVVRRGRAVRIELVR